MITAISGRPSTLRLVEAADVVLVLSAWKRYRYLLVELARREIADRYAHQTIGSLWAWLHPLFLMLLYTVIFNFVFEARFDGAIDLPLDFTTFVLAGLVPWLCLQDVLGRSCGAVLDHASYVRQMAFPIEVLPIKRALSSLPILLTGMTFLLAYQLVTFGHLPWTILLWPLFLGLLVLFATGIVFLLGAIGVFLRDLREVVSVFCTANLFLMPIMFIPSLTPPLLEVIYYANPFSYMVWMHQDIVFYGRIEHPFAWVVFPLLSFVLILGGSALFRRLRPQFGDAV
ncbi:MAG: ABC transporter permease [Geminicoccaceae bacterium]